MKFSIITVSYNPGGKLKETLHSVAKQTYRDYEVIVKDGGSTDGSTDFLKEIIRGHFDACNAVFSEEFLNRIRFFEGKDKGIYDAMNQAVAQATGEFVLFLNCGDMLADERVLERVAAVIDETRSLRNQEIEAERKQKPYVFYGDTFSDKTKVTIASAPRITGFTCYRNIPCHQSCFYSTDLCKKKPYDLQYKIRGDYEHFLWCFYRGKAEFVHMDFAVSSYEGGGYSESKENMQRDKQEHRQITSAYMRKAELLKYKTIMALTLAPLRRKMAENKVFSGVYHWIKEEIYKQKQKMSDK